LDLAVGQRDVLVIGREDILHVLLDGLDADVQRTPDLAVGKSEIEQAMKLKPDVVLLDVRMPDTDGLEALERISDRSPRTKIVMFTGHENPTYVARAVADFHDVHFGLRRVGSKHE